MKGLMVSARTEEGEPKESSFFVSYTKSMFNSIKYVKMDVHTVLFVNISLWNAH